MLSIYLSLLVALAGLLIYALTKPDNPKVGRIGEIMFFCGLLAFLVTGAAAHIVTVLGK